MNDWRERLPPGLDVRATLLEHVEIYGIPHGRQGEVRAVVEDAGFSVERLAYDTATATLVNLGGRAAHRPNDKTLWHLIATREARE